MAKPIQADLVGDSREFVKSVEKGTESVEDLNDEIDDLGKSNKALKPLTDDLKDLPKVAKKAGDDAGDNLSKGLKGGTDDFKSEAASSGREAAASFSGGFEDITGMVQEIAANAFAGFGPGGAALGLLAGAGIGIAGALFGQAEEDRKALEEKAVDLANAYIEAGTSVLDTLALASRIGDIVTSDDKGTKDDVKDLTKALGDRSLALRVLAGDSEALATAQGILNSKRLDLGDQMLSASGKRKSALGEEKEAVEDLTRILGEQSGVQASATAMAEDYSNALKDMAGDATEAERQVDALGNVLLTLPDGTQIVIDAETGMASDNLANFTGDVEALPKEHVTDVKTQISIDEVAKGKATSMIDRFRTDNEQASKGPKVKVDADTSAADAKVKQTKDTAGKAQTFALTANAQVNWSQLNHPPTIYVPAVLVKPGTKQPI